MDQKTLEEQLFAHFGYRQFKIGQREIIEEVLQGRDCLGILPTGSGKSLCYQLPAKLLPGITIVVSPLISLMIDQVKQLKAANFKNVVAINSFMSYKERKYVYAHLKEYSLIYLSPEMLQQDELMAALCIHQISLLVIDEAHCISQWGHEFRPDYLKLQSVSKKFHQPPILALSATATQAVQADIITYLGRPKMIKHIYPMDRKNIIFQVQKVDNDAEKMDILLGLFRRVRIPTIIYFSSRQMTEIITQQLVHQTEQRVAFYHGGMDQTDRVQIQQQFMNDELDIICCTSAFGMGINKENIRLVVHYHLPPQMESYIQEVGRAGRDGLESVGLLLYANHDARLPSHLIKSELPTEADLTRLQHLLSEMAKQGEKLPETSEQVETMFGLNEIQWRFLYYQLEKHGMIIGNLLQNNSEKWKKAFDVIRSFMWERINLKTAKLTEMLAWVHCDTCLRKALYRPFQSSFRQPDGPCCVNCGFQLALWEPASVPAHNGESNWQDRLYQLFHIC